MIYAPIFQNTNVFLMEPILIILTKKMLRPKMMMIKMMLEPKMMMIKMML
jgi:hypothetical protein